MAKLLRLLVLFASSVAHQAYAQDVCQTLAADLKQDVLIQGSSSELFNSYQQIIKEEKYSDYKSAKDTSLGIGITIPDYVDFSLNSKSNENNWQSNRQTFLAMTYSTLASSARSSLESRRTNVESIKAIADCRIKIAEAQGFFIQLSDVKDTRDSFSFTLFKKSLGNSGFKIREFSVIPNSAGAVCTGEVTKASTSKPLIVSGNSLAVSCTKIPDRAVTVTINTDQGSGGPFSIGSVNDQWKTVFEKLQLLERAVVPTATVAFFDLPECPIGWSFDDRSQGRYIVGVNASGTRGAVVGTKLSDLENRATGQHTHPFTAFGGPGRGGEGVQGGRDSQTHHENRLTTEEPSGGVPGTNAPYLQLRACKKD